MFSRGNPLVRLAAIGAVLMATAGCGGMYDSYVAGAVSLDGQAITTGAVAFFPSAGGSPAYGTIDGSGRYEIYTGREPGLHPGSYGVTVIAREPPQTDKVPPGTPPPPGKAITPQWYAMAQYSPLKFDVASGDNEINLELTSSPPPGWKPTSR